MIRRLVGWVLLLAFVVASVPVASSGAEQAAAASGVDHADCCPPSSAPGPAAPFDDPCGSDCLCASCPAHTLAPLDVQPRVSGPVTQTHRYPSDFSRDHHPSDFHDRIFHPPRRG